ncbi:MAG TPA: hypothetical protein DGR97_14655 [Gammaproteobacteria bacterium]|nr:hypothetical protein [Gammaproteobacteria bacterium]
MQLVKISLLTLTFCLALNACSDSALQTIKQPNIPFVHKIDIQQGNVVTQQMVAQLRLGMDKRKVRFVMGTPIIRDTFHANRWDYIYTFHKGGSNADERRLITAVFNEDGNLMSLEGSIVPALGPIEVDIHQDTSVEVPGDLPKTGVLEKLKIAMPFTGEDEPELAGDDKSKNTDSDEENSNSGTKLFSDDDSEDLKDEEAARIAEAEKTAVVVPGGAPPKKRKGLFQRLADSVGLGAADEDLETDRSKEDLDYDPDDPKYRDQTDPETFGSTAVIMPDGAPPTKRKGFFKRLMDTVGLDAADENRETDKSNEELDYEADDPKYRDQTDPETLGDDS